MTGGDAVDLHRAVEAEVGQYSELLANRPRWLVLNKLDLLPAEEREARVAQLVRELDWHGPVYAISALTAEGTKRLAQDVMTFLETEDREKKRAGDASASGHGA